VDERPSWTWLTDAHEAIAADVHHRHGLDWYTMPTAPGFRLALLLLQTPGTYTAAAAPMSDRWRALADMNGVPSG
jgi:hypothetical protein